MRMSFRLPCFIVGAIQLAIVVATIYEKVWELNALEEPYNVEEHLLPIVIYLVETCIALSLIKATYTGHSTTILIWLLTIMPFFIFATIYAFFFAWEEVDNYQQILNCVVVFLIWLAWYVVLRFYMETRKGKLKKLHNQCKRY